MKEGTQAIAVLPASRPSFFRGSAARLSLSLLHDVCSSPASRELISLLRHHSEREAQLRDGNKSSVVDPLQRRGEPFIGLNQLVIHISGRDDTCDHYPDTIYPDACVNTPMTLTRVRNKAGWVDGELSLRAPIQACLGHGAAAACLASMAGQVRDPFLLTRHRPPRCIAVNFCFFCISHRNFLRQLLQPSPGLVSRNSREYHYSALQVQ